MNPLKALLPLLCLLISGCINLPDIESPLPGDPAPDAGFLGDGGTSSDAGSDGGSDGGTSDGGIDQTPPTIVRTSPPNSATRVPLDSTVEIDFSEDMTVSTLQLSSAPPVSFNLSSWVPASRRAVFSPVLPLEQDEQYTVSVEGKDLAGNSLAGTYSFAFTTVGSAPDTTPPTLIDSSPADGAFGVPRTTTIKLTFSEPMNKASVEQAFSVTSPPGSTIGTAIWNSSGTEVELTPEVSFSYGAHVFWTLSEEATDLTGNALSTPLRNFRIIRLSVLRLEFQSSNSTLASTEFVDQQTPWHIGDDPTNKPYHGFVSFSLQPLSSYNVTTILSAILTWPYTDPGINPFTSLGRFMVDPVNYGLSTNGVYTTPSIGVPLLLNYQDFGVQSGHTSIPVTAMVADAWNNRSSRYGLAQFRLKFEYTTDNDNNADSLLINPNVLYLDVTCEHR